ncbi:MULTISPECIES: YggS family pyridoxal phosphate-dependent enzyme [Niastella]|uniref:Pyridoxal phosphate homeostasis protein n=1 Tax=Niastella soli TaxID=2821487 RepID=A0ABS3Z1E0_9BACT|nr:YggS family pyridoxal phosphate-dependent enzyme [Niastella soli]MBO9203577.1 YggS family pyridoxal phosphate-dependent enzyme [Niastella soli]
MAVNTKAYLEINEQLQSQQVTLVAVSKTKPVSDIQELYDLGQRDFGENYVQELVEKQLILPNDIRWHFIGHLQSNKVKYIAPYVHLIHGVDSYKLLLEIDKQAKKLDRTINCLLQVHVAEEETKFGFNELELMEAMEAIHKYKLLNQLQNVQVAGLMAMASNTDNTEQISKEFAYLKMLFDHFATKPGNDQFRTLSMGMSSDYQLAIAEGSNLVRIGSLLFGTRQ